MIGLNGRGTDDDVLCSVFVPVSTAETPLTLVPFLGVESLRGGGHVTSGFLERLLFGSPAESIKRVPSLLIQ